MFTDDACVYVYLALLSDWFWGLLIFLLWNFALFNFSLDSLRRTRRGRGEGMLGTFKNSIGLRSRVLVEVLLFLWTRMLLEIFSNIFWQKFLLLLLEFNLLHPPLKIDVMKVHIAFPKPSKQEISFFLLCLISLFLMKSAMHKRNTLMFLVLMD